MSFEAAGDPADTWQEQLKLTDAKAMRALAHPVRMSLLELLGAVGTLTATQASEALGESPANCAFHLRTLAKYGFVKEAGGGRGRERPWVRSQRSLRVSSTDQDDAKAALAAGALGMAWFEHWAGRARRAFGTSARLPGWEHATEFTTSALFLTPAETEAMNAEILQIVDRFRDREREPSLRPAGSLPVQFAFSTFPVAEFASPAGQSRDIS